MVSNRGGSQAPYLKDDTLYPFCKGIINNKLKLEFSPRRNFPPWLTFSKYNKFLNKGYVPDWRCFVSNVQCIAFSEHDLIKAKRLAEHYWSLSLEHLVPVRVQGDERIHRLINQVLMGSRLNQNLGHIPLALKLHHRKQLKECDYDRDDFSSENFYTIRKYTIGFEDQLKLGGKYPWQPWAYTNSKHKIAAEDFCDKLKKVDHEFLSLSVWERYKWFDEFEWKW